MKVTAKYTGQVKAVIGTATECFELDYNSTVSTLIRKIAAQHGDKARSMLLDANGGVHKVLICVINDAQTPPGTDAVLKDGDAVTLIPPISGG